MLDVIFPEKNKTILIQRRRSIGADTVISDFHKPTYLPKNWISYVDGPYSPSMSYFFLTSLVAFSAFSGQLDLQIGAPKTTHLPFYEV